MLPISQITDEKVALEIGLPDELVMFARMVNSGELSGRADVTVRLTADLDMTGTKWVPIGFGGACFSGVFDGGGHTISGVTFRKEWPGNYGLFGYVTGTLQNVTVTGTIYNRSGEPHSAVGGIVGEIINKAVDRPVQVRNCVSLGELTCLGKDGPAHPITAYAEGAVFENNYYDESLPAQGREDLRAAVAAGCAAKPAAYLTSNEFLEDMERRGGRYALGTDGMLTVRELENGGNAYDDE